MPQPILVALIAGVCSIISATLAALITKYGLPFWGTSTVIRARGSASESLLILPDGSISMVNDGFSYVISNASLKIAKDKVSFSAILNSTSPTGEVIVSDADFTGDGKFENGVAFLTYHVNDSRNAQKWCGLLLLRVPGLGNISGYWIAEDHINAGHIAMGSACLVRI